MLFIDKQRGASRLAAVDAHARSLGLKAGMALADARARLPTLRAVASCPKADAAFLARLADIAQTFTPSVTHDLPDGLALDITGCAHLFGTEEKLASRLANALRKAGASTLRLAVAPTPDMARAIARFARTTPSFVSDDERVRTLPVAALECGHDDTVALKRAGLRTIADVADRPSILFTARFTQQFSQKLARILGEDDSRITPLRTLPPCRTERSFPEPVATHDVIARIVRELANDACEELRERGEGGRAFMATFMRSDGAMYHVGIATSRPTRDPAVIMRLYRDRIETLADPLDPGFGFDFIRFEALRTQPFTECQTTLDAREDKHDKLSRLVDRLSTIFGPQRVTRLQPVDSHMPERAQAVIPAGAVTAASIAWASAPPTGMQAALRPATLFARPQPIEVENHPQSDTPASLRWRRFTHRLAQAVGPERISDEWWRPPSGYGTRDYFRVESTNGARFWIFRAMATEPPVQHRWFLHGLFP